MSGSEFSGGAYSEVRAKCEAGDGKVAVTVLKLALILEHAERKKGTPLVEAEVISLRDRAPAIQMDRVDFVVLTKSRGPDLDPDDIWAQWCIHRRAKG